MSQRPKLTKREIEERELKKKEQIAEILKEYNISKGDLEYN